MNGSAKGLRPPETAIVVEGLGKQYHIGLKESRHDTLLKSAGAWLASPVANYRQLRRLSRVESDGVEDVIWALRDVSFTIHWGEVVGIVGRNGAGKSTLLKILSRITLPSEGRVILNGRVSSLLEIGTGFHPELTGRENVYLNGTILGMRKAEVDRQFDEIVAFAEVEPFIDTPVKRYSSGMRLRLAFAVSAHLQADILLVDEVLAVGDAAFQEKCLNKMEGVVNVGRTVLLVSHNMQVIQRLCQRALLLRKGRLAAAGAPSSIVNDYLSDALATSALEPVAWGQQLRVNRLSVSQNDAPAGDFLDSEYPFEIHVHYDVLRPLRNLLLGFNVVAGDGIVLFRTYDMLTYGLGEREPGGYESVFQLPGGLLPPGNYFFEVVVGIHRLRWLSQGEIRLRLNVGGARQTDVTFPGVLSPVGSWTVYYDGGHVKTAETAARLLNGQDNHIDD
jgi:lipopolysaccharide transport system ATP-binding protein